MRNLLECFAKTRIKHIMQYCNPDLIKIKYKVLNLFQGEFAKKKKSVSLRNKFAVLVSNLTQRRVICEEETSVKDVISAIFACGHVWGRILLIYD